MKNLKTILSALLLTTLLFEQFAFAFENKQQKVLSAMSARFASLSQEKRKELIDSLPLLIEKAMTGIEGISERKFQRKKNRLAKRILNGQIENEEGMDTNLAAQTVLKTDRLSLLLSLAAAKDKLSQLKIDADICEILSTAFVVGLGLLLLGFAVPIIGYIGFGIVAILVVLSIPAYFAWRCD